MIVRCAPAGPIVPRSHHASIGVSDHQNVQRQHRPGAEQARALDERPAIAAVVRHRYRYRNLQGWCVAGQELVGLGLVVPDEKLVWHGRNGADRGQNEGESLGELHRERVSSRLDRDRKSFGWGERLLRARELMIMRRPARRGDPLHQDKVDGEGGCDE